MNIVISGVSRGIGFEAVKSFVSQGNHQIVCVSRNMEKLLELKEICQQINPKSTLFPISYDLSRTDYDSSLIPEILNCVPNVDILINNAGAIHVDPFEKVSRENLLHLYRVNVEAAYFLCQALSPYFNEKSHIVNMSSMGGFQDSIKFPGLSAYSLTKGAIACFTQVLAEEWKERTIAVNCLAIGAVNTDMLEEAFPGYQAPIDADEMGAYLADFAIKGARYYNGKILPVALSTP